MSRIQEKGLMAIQIKGLKAILSLQSFLIYIKAIRQWEEPIY